MTLTSEDKVNGMTSSLLHHFSSKSEAPATYLNEDGGSLVLGLASGMWSILTLGYGSEDPHDTELTSKTPLSDMSLLLILILTNHCTDTNVIMNPYRRSLFNCGLDTEAKSFDFDFAPLFQTLCATLSSDESTLLLYLMLHQNPAFRSHILASSDIELIVLPILQTLYKAPSNSSHHIYMSLIVLLILSEDDLFNTSVHDVVMKKVEWYTERALQDVSLGGLLILVVIRTIQYNMLKMRVSKFFFTIDFV